MVDMRFDFTIKFGTANSTQILLFLEFVLKIKFTNSIF